MKPGPWRSAQRVLLRFCFVLIFPSSSPSLLSSPLRAKEDHLLAPQLSELPYGTHRCPTLLSRITCRLSCGDHSRCPAVGWRGTDWHSQGSCAPSLSLLVGNKARSDVSAGQALCCWHNVSASSPPLACLSFVSFHFLLIVFSAPVIIITEEVYLSSETGYLNSTGNFRNEDKINPKAICCSVGEFFKL